MLGFRTVGPPLMPTSGAAAWSEWLDEDASRYNLITPALVQGQLRTARARQSYPRQEAYHLWVYAGVSEIAGSVGVLE